MYHMLRAITIDRANCGSNNEYMTSLLCDKTECINIVLLCVLCMLFRWFKVVLFIFRKNKTKWKA